MKNFSLGGIKTKSVVSAANSQNPTKGNTLSSPREPKKGGSVFWGGGFYTIVAADNTRVSVQKTLSTTGTWMHPEPIQILSIDAVRKALKEVNDKVASGGTKPVDTFSADKVRDTVGNTDNDVNSNVIKSIIKIIKTPEELRSFNFDKDQKNREALDDYYVRRDIKEGLGK